MKKHTPGPWIMDANGLSHSWNVSNSEKSICDVTHKPDAELIAAAPDLLETLKVVWHNGRNEPNNALLARIEKAIAQAEPNE